MEITVTTQAELDALPDKFEEWTRIYIKSETRIIVHKARGNSSVEARGNSSVEAWGNSSVEAWGNSSVEAWENSSVEAWENSSVEAWENSSVEAWGNTCTHLQSDFCSVALWGYAVAYLLSKKAKAALKSKTATIIKPELKKGTDAWLESQGIEPTEKVILFKRVSSDYKTQERTLHETVWAIGSKLTHPEWNPKESECGAGKFHACSRPYFCDEFRSERGDRYIAIKVAKEDLYVWPNAEYPHKVAFRACTVLHECDRFAKEIK